MNDKAESQTLLAKKYISDNQPYRGDGGSSSGEDSCRSDEWWEGSASESGSSCSSCCSDSNSEDGSSAEWEGEVDSHGNLFFIRSPPASELQKYSQPAPEKVSAETTPSSLPESQPTRRGKLAGLIRRRNSKRYRHKAAAATSTDSQPANHSQEEQPTGPSGLPSVLASSITSHPYSNQDNEPVHEVSLHIDPGGRHNLGRRASTAETLLGLVVAPAEDGSRVKVVGFVPNGEAIRHHGIRVGDWLSCINGQEVTMQTLDLVLGAFSSPCKIQLRLQRFPIEGAEANADNDQQVTGELSERVCQLVCVSASEDLLAAVLAAGCGAVYLTQEGLSSGEEAEDQSLLYCFPAPASKNALAGVRGALLTLHLLLPQMAPSTPSSTTVALGTRLAHVLYWPQGPELLLLALPAMHCPVAEARQLIADVARHLQFCYQTLSKAFTVPEFQAEVDRFFTLFFSRLLSGEPPGPRFEELMPAAHWVPLPSHAQVRLNSVLSELESNNFEELGANINECQRLFTIIGSCMYHKGYLLASHLPKPDLPDVHALLRQQGLLTVLRAEPLRRLVQWREVFPSSCFRGLPPDANNGGPRPAASCPVPLGRWFLLVVGQEWDLLAVLLECAGCTVTVTNNPGPDICFIEEAFDTLSYIQSTGISAIASKWVASQPRPQVTTPEAVYFNKAARHSDNFLGFMRNSESKGSPSSLASSSLLSVNSPSSRKQADSTSLTKRRGSLDRTHFGGSEDSASLQASSMLSECSDETGVGGAGGSSGGERASGPVVGRRAERELRASAGSRSSGGSGPVPPRSDGSDSDDSDWEAYQAYSRRGYAGSSSEVSDATLSWLADVDEVLPCKLTAGEENMLFHYVQLDVWEGVLLAPPTGREAAPAASQLREVLASFRRSCHSIHSLLQNTVGFKKLMGQEVTKTISRSLVAIKEHGVLFEITPPAESDKKAQPLTYWVVGRLFFTPHPREVYVCYLDSAPQNMVEIAFRLGLSTAG